MSNHPTLGSSNPEMEKSYVYEQFTLRFEKNAFEKSFHNFISIFIQNLEYYYNIGWELCNFIEKENLMKFYLECRHWNFEELKGINKNVLTYNFRRKI